jgi:hypothetical protein
MAFQAKFTAQFGKTDPAQIAIAAGDAEAQTDTISINMDVTTMRRDEVVMVLEKLTQRILSASFPPL